MLTANGVNVREAFYAQAVADAAGRLFEFGNPSQLEVRYYLGRKDEPLFITDDTQMAMFGQEAINEAGGPARFQRNYKQPLKDAYLRWYRTQWHMPASAGAKGLEAHPLMRRTEAPGRTCMRALGHLHRHGEIENNRSTGCGAVMRLLPFAALEGLVSSASLQLIALYSAQITHQGPEIPKAVMLYLQAATELFITGELHDVGPRFRDAKTIEAFGSGWTSLSCVEMALWAVIHADDYDDLLIKSICHNGDSDSVAAVAGSLWGLAGRGGYECYLPRLQQKDLIDSLF